MKEIAFKIKNEIEAASNVLLHCHPYPDPDSICSALALQEVLIGMGKRVTIIRGDSDIPTSLGGLENIASIKNLEWSQVDKTDYDLFIILDSSSLSQVSQKVEVVIPVSMKTIVIDHHKTNTRFGDINLIEDGYASTSHILYELFNLWGLPISKTVALCLFVGIYSDTGGFRYPVSTPEVFQVALALVILQPDYHSLLFTIENNKSPIELEMLGLALSSIEKHHNDRIVFSSIPYFEIKNRQLTREQAMEGLVADTLRSVQGWFVVASLVEAEPGVVTVSLRTRDEFKYDMSLIATNVGVKGGGHRGAAGTTINKGLNQAKDELLEKLLLHFPDLA